MPELSVVVPVFNEQENLAELGAEIRQALRAIEYEVLFVDDGSTDRSFEVIKKLAAEEPRFKALRLAANFGQTAAMSAGIAYAAGRLIAFLDSDLQNDPADIPAMLRKLGEGFDAVSGWRRNRKDPFLTRRLPSMAANAVISRVTGVRLHDYGCTLKLYKAQFLKDLRLCGEMHRFLPAYAGFMGARIAELEVHHRPRSKGISKYGLSRTFKVLLDLITVKFMDAYITKPIYLFGGGGLCMVLAGALLALWTLYKKFHLGVFVKDQPLFQVSIFFGLVGIQMVLMGLLAEILIRIYYDVREREPYFVRERIGLR
ncbi:MAG: glycosyltransferase family 2 protein [Elusimicrobia bacterium]|nr:glycosyltransferase family 2 protein [Elusimicrobiota bacterium]